jgi:hypothetical protein
MSRRNSFKTGRAWVAVAAFAVVGAGAWAGEKIEVSTGRGVLPSNVATNKTGELEEPSAGLKNFNDRINQNESRFGWQRNLPGNRPNVGMVAPPAPVRRPAKGDKDKKNEDWLTPSASGELDYEGALGVGSMFQKPKASATSSEASAAASGTPSPSPSSNSGTASPGLTSRSERLSGATSVENPFAAQTSGFGRSEAVSSSALSDLGLANRGGFDSSPRASGFSVLPSSPNGYTPLESSQTINRTVDSILGRSRSLEPSSVPTLQSILNRGSAVSATQSRFETGVDDVLRSYRTPTAPEPVLRTPSAASFAVPTAPSLTLQDALGTRPGGLDSLDSSKRLQQKVETPRGFLDPASRPPAVLPGPTRSYGF